MGWFVGGITNAFGKKKTAFTALLVGAVILIFLPLLNSPIAIIGLVLLALTFFALAWPSINGAYANYISETTKYEKEIEGLEDFATNFGYTAGPALAEFLADRAGNMLAFSFLGGFCIVVSIILLKVTPRSINVKI